MSAKMALKKMNFIAFDLETSGLLPEFALQPWRVEQGKAYVTSLAIAWHEGEEVKSKGGLAPTAGQMAGFLKEAIGTDSRVCAWNAVFDISWLLAYGLEELVFKVKWLDGMLLWRHYFIEPEYEITRLHKRSYRLQECIKEILPDFVGYKDDVDFYDPDPEVRARLQEINRQDTIAALLATEHWWSLLTPRQRRAALIEADSLPHIARANLNGMRVDTLAATELARHLENIAAGQLEKLSSEGVSEAITRSPVKLAKLLFDDWKSPVLKESIGKKTGRITRSTDKEVLHELSFKDPRAAELRLYREALNNKTKFADAPLASVAYNQNARTHPLARPFATYSGRMTYASKQAWQSKDIKGHSRNHEAQTGFALHQEKRAGMFRDIVLPPDGYTLVEFDAAGQEFKWMALAAGDPVMLAMCLPGEDAHCFMGSRIRGWDYRDLIKAVEAGDNDAKIARQVGKLGNLSLQYRTAALKLRTVARLPPYLIPMELPEAQLIHALYRRTYVNVPTYWAQQIAETKKLGYVETLAGRRVQVTGNWEGSFGWAMGSTAINYRIQGTSADQKYLAISVLNSYLINHGVIFAWDLHDGLYFFVPDVKVQRVTHDMKHILDNLPYEKAWGFKPSIPMPWDCKAGKSWGSLKEMKQ